MPKLPILGVIAHRTLRGTTYGADGVDASSGALRSPSSHKRFEVFPGNGLTICCSMLARPQEFGALHHVHVSAAGCRLSFIEEAQARAQPE